MKEVLNKIYTIVEIQYLRKYCQYSIRSMSGLSKLKEGHR